MANNFLFSSWPSIQELVDALSKYLGHKNVPMFKEHQHDKSLKELLGTKCTSTEVTKLVKNPSDGVLLYGHDYYIEENIREELIKRIISSLQSLADKEEDFLSDLEAFLSDLEKTCIDIEEEMKELLREVQAQSGVVHRNVCYSDLESDTAYDLGGNLLYAMKDLGACMGHWYILKFFAIPAVAEITKELLEANDVATTKVIYPGATVNADNCVLNDCQIKHFNDLNNKNREFGLNHKEMDEFFGYFRYFDSGDSKYLKTSNSCQGVSVINIDPTSGQQI